MRVLYLKPFRRRPIQVSDRCWPEDMQRALPRAWCHICGREIYALGKELCPRCEKEETNEQQCL